MTVTRKHEDQNLDIGKKIKVKIATKKIMTIMISVNRDGVDIDDGDDTDQYYAEDDDVAAGDVIMRSMKKSMILIDIIMVVQMIIVD